MSIAHWKEREKEQRQNDILNVAEKLFFKKGYDDVSMNDIAKEVGLGKSTLYFYFNSKEELFFAVALRGIRILSEMIEDAVQKEKTNIKKLSAFKEVYNRFTKKYPGYYWTYKYFQSGRFDLIHTIDISAEENEKQEKKLKTQVSSQSNSQNNPYLMEILKLRHEIFSVVYNIIKKGIDEGSFRPDINPAETAVILTIITEGVQNIRSDLVKILENHEISQEIFESDSRKFISYILLKN